VHSTGLPNTIASSASWSDYSRPDFRMVQSASSLDSHTFVIEFASNCSPFNKMKSTYLPRGHCYYSNGHLLCPWLPGISTNPVL